MIRLSNTEALNFRNNANSGDVNGLSKNSSDVVAVGGSAGISTTGPVAASGNISTTGNLSVTGTSTFTGTPTFNGTPNISITNGTITTANNTITLTTSGNSFTIGSTVFTPVIGQYNGTATAGQGVSWIPAITTQKNETAADTSVLSYTPAAAAGTYRVSFVMSLSAANTATLGWTMTWKDSNGNAQSPTNLSLLQEGTAAPALTFTTSSAGNYYATAVIDVDNSQTAIVVKTTFSGTSFAGKVTATIERLI